MKISTFDFSAMKDRAISSESTITIETAQGRFTITERADGSLAIHESSHNHLAILPRTGNSVELHAVASPNFRQEDKV